MKKNIKLLLGLLLGITIVISTTVGATTIFNSKDIIYNSDKTDKNNVKDSLDELYIKAENSGKCPNGMFCYTSPKQVAGIKIGDYIKMTPTSTSYTIPTSVTGNNSAQTINPSELNLWRVIRKNDDGTIDMISEYVSSTNIKFDSSLGYINFVGGLNAIAAQYTNSKYINRTRHIGYSNQTETLTSTSKLNQTTKPWTKATSLSNEWQLCNASTHLCGIDENLGAGDIGYIEEYNLVNKALGTMVGKALNGKSTSYWLSSRYYNYTSNNNSWYFNARIVTDVGGLSYKTLACHGTCISTIYNGYAIRPILTLKGDIELISGDGKSAETAYQLA